MKAIKFGKLLFVVGIVLSLAGLSYTLGYTDSIYFKYVFSIGIILLGIGVFVDGIDGIRNKKDR